MSRARWGCLILAVHLLAAAHAAGQDCAAYDERIGPVAWLRTSMTVNDVALHGDRAVAAAGLVGLVVVDLADPATPRVEVTLDLDAWASSITCDGDRAYVGVNEDGFRVVDLADASAPGLLAAVDTPGSALDVALRGTAAYVADWTGGVHVYDVADPAAPALVRTLAVGPTTRFLLPGERYGYVGVENHLEVWDLLDPLDPAYVTEVNLPGEAYAAAGTGALLHVACGAAGLQVLDLTDPAAPALRGNVPLAGTASDVAAAGSRVHVAGLSGGLHVVDAADPGHPALLGTYGAGAPVRRLCADGGRVHVAMEQAGLATFDVAAGAAAAPVGALAVVPERRRAAADGTRVYLAGQLHGLAILDASDPTNPALLGGVPELASCRGIDLAGTTAFVATTRGLETVDCADPGAPVVLDLVAEMNGAESVLVDGRYVYVGVHPDRLLVVDALDPSRLARVTEVEVCSSPVGLALDGRTLGVAGSYGVTLVDMTEPTAPVVRADVATDVVAESAAFADGLLGVPFRTSNRPDQQNGVALLDARDPDAVAPVSTVITAVPYDALLLGHHLYTGDAFLGLLVHDVADPAAPVLVGALGVGDGIHGLAAAGRLVHVATYEGLVTAWRHCDDTAVRVEERPRDDPSPPVAAGLAVHPNPFNPRTRVVYAPERDGLIDLAVHDLRGRRVRTLVRGFRAAGRHVVDWDGRDDAGRDLAAGAYLVRVADARAVRVRKVMLVR